MKVEVRTGCLKRPLGDPNICIDMKFWDQPEGYVFLDAQFVVQVEEGGRYMTPTFFIDTETGVPFNLMHWLERVCSTLPRFAMRADRWFSGNHPGECNHTANEFYESVIAAFKEEFPELAVDRADLRSEANES